VRNLGLSLTLLVLLTIPCAAFGQASMSIQMNKAEKTVVGLPFSADQSVRSVQHLANGMALIHQIKGRVYRSADGVERFEGTAVTTDASQPSPTTLVWIIDPMKHTAMSLNTNLKTAMLTHLPENAAVTVRFLPQQQPAGPGRAVQPTDLVTTDLGHRTQDMLPIVGKRIKGIIAIDKIGNEQPIEVTTEFWVAPQLKLIVKQTDQDPRIGERFFELSNIRSEEPDPKLFELPEGYTLKEQGNSVLKTLIPPAPPVPDTKTPQIEEATNSPNSALKNDVAYKLAMDNAHLPSAQSLAEQAVLMEEKQTANLDPERANAEAFSHMMILSRYWTTIGWVYFREGKLAQAEAFTRAAWELAPQGFVGAHLGRIYDKEHRPKDAIDIYRMALNAPASPSQREQIQTRLVDLGEIKPDPLPLAITTPLPSLNPQLPGSDGAAVVDIILTHDNPPAVFFLQGSSTLREPVTKAIQTALATALPDSGPERVFRRARITCAVGETPACMLHFVSSRETRTGEVPLF